MHVYIRSCVGWRSRLDIFISLSNLTFLRQGLSLNLEHAPSALGNKHVLTYLAFYVGAGPDIWTQVLVSAHPVL